MKKGIFVGLVFIGILSSVFAVLGPIHESFHWITATLSGVHSTMHWTYLSIADSNMTIPIAFAGMFGEIITLTVLFWFFSRRGKYKIATYLFGYMAAFSLVAIFSKTGTFMMDIDAALGIASAALVQLLYNLWRAMYFCLLIYQIGTIILKRRVFFVQKVEKPSKMYKISNKILTSG